MTDQPPTISDVVASAERTDDVLQRTLRSFGPEGRAVLVPVHSGVVELTVLIKTLTRDISTAQAMEAADPELLRRMDKVAKQLTASIDYAAARLLTTKGITEQTRLGLLDASEQASETATLARQYVTNTLAAKRRKGDEP